MALVLAKKTRLKADIRLAQAVSEFIADLSQEQKTTFNDLRQQSCNSAPDARDVMRFTADMDQKIAGVIKGRCFGPRFTNFLQGVQQFAALGDVIVGGSQNVIACGVWSLVRMSLLSIINASTYLEKLSSLFMAIGRSAPRYQNIVLLYPQSTNLSTYLSEYFIVVVHLCHHIFKYTQRSTFRQITSSLNDFDLKGFQSELDLWGNSIKEEMNILIAKRIEHEATASARFRTVSVKSRETEFHQRRLAANLRVLDFCSKYNGETTWKQIRKIGNASIFKQVQEYQDWKNKPDSCTLWYSGKLGSGKSVLLANIVDDLHIDNRSKDIPVAFFFCRHDIPVSLKGLTVLGSLARQLLRTLPDLAAVTDLCGETSATGYEVILKIIRQVLPPQFEAYFVLDGLDECDMSERERLVQQLEILQQFLTLHICISFRVDPSQSPLNLPLERCAAPKVISIPEVNPDIDTFIEAELSRCLNRQELVLGDPKIILEIRDALSQGSHGMFLWVALQLRTLCEMKTDQAIQSALADLPQDLAGTFSRILRKSKGSGPSEPYQQTVLRVVTAAYLPLTTDAFREALSVVPGNTVWSSSMLLNDVYSTLAYCGCLLVVDEEERTVRFIHHSVKQFLLDRPSTSEHGFTYEQAHTAMAEIVLTYLGYGVSRPVISTSTIPQMMVQSTPSRVIQSTGNSLGTVRHLALKLLEYRKQPNFDISTILANTHNPIWAPLVDEIQFYGYASTHWIRHLTRLSKTTAILDSLFDKKNRELLEVQDVSSSACRLLLIWGIKIGQETVVKRLFATKRNALGLEDRRFSELLHHWATENRHERVIQIVSDNVGAIAKPGAVNRGFSLLRASDFGLVEFLQHFLEIHNQPNTNEWDWPYTEALLEASRVGHISIVRLLIEKLGPVYANSPNKDKLTPLYMASMEGHNEVVDLLLGSGASASPVDTKHPTPLTVASKNGHATVVRLLLGKGADPNTVDHDGQSPLFLASTNGHYDIVVLLVGNGVKINARDRDDNTPLFGACKHGHIEIAEFLIHAGAVVNDHINTNSGSLMPLHIASNHGHVRLVGVLLDHSASVDYPYFKRTALMMASENGHVETVKLLLKRESNPDLVNSRGQSPYFMAAERGFVDVCRVFFEKKVAKEIVDQDGHTPLYMASLNDHIHVARLLLDNGVDPDGTNPNYTPLNAASFQGHVSISELLLEYGALPDLNDKGGWAPLHTASINGRFKMVELLLRNKAEVNAMVKGFTPLMLATRHGRLDIVKVLMEHMARIDFRNEGGWTALNAASWAGDLEIVKLLIKSGADPNVANNVGSTPLNSASENNHIEIMKVLLAHGGNPDIQCDLGWTSLYIASKSGYYDIVALLLAHGANPDLADKNDYTPLQVAWTRRHISIVKILGSYRSEIDLTCDICKETFSGRYQLQAFRDHQNGMNCTKQNFDTRKRCRACGKEFSRIELCMSHEMEVHGMSQSR